MTTAAGLRASPAVGPRPEDAGARSCSSREGPDERLARVQADLVELEIAVLRRRLVPAGEIERRWARAVDAIRAELLMLPDRAELGLDEARRDVLRELVAAALGNLANFDPGATPFNCMKRTIIHGQ